MRSPSRPCHYDSKDTWTKQDEISELIAAKLQNGDQSRVDGAHGAAQDLACARAGLWGDSRRPAGQAHEVLVTVPGTGNAKAPITVVNHPVLYDGATAEVEPSPQQLGAQTAEVLAELGFTSRGNPRAGEDERIITTGTGVISRAPTGRHPTMKEDFYVKPGDSVTFAKTVGETDIYLFAGITGDFAVNHVNEQYMARSKYGKRIAHGVLRVGLRLYLLLDDDREVSRHRRR